jgi:hypothetical protein
LIFFLKKGHACKDPNASQDIEEKTDGSIQKGEMTASVQTEVATQRERDQGLQGLPPKAVLGFEKLHDFVGGK